MKYIVLLRGINISGKNKIAMSELNGKCIFVFGSEKWLEERVKKEASSIILYSKKGYIDDVNIELSHIR